MDQSIWVHYAQRVEVEFASTVCKTVTPTLRYQSRPVDSTRDKVMPRVELDTLEGAVRRASPRKLMLLGEPGVGKSHMARWICWFFAKRFLEASGERYQIPVFINLDLYSRESRLPRLLASRWEAHGIQTYDASGLATRRRCGTDKCCLYVFDGFDRVGSSEIVNARSELAMFIAEHEQDSVLITCRKGVNLDFGELEQCELLALNQEQVRSYFETRIGIEKAKGVLIEIERNGLIDLAGIPFYLNAIISWFSTPQSRKERPPVTRAGWLEFLIQDHFFTKETDRWRGMGKVFPELAISNFLSAVAYRTLRDGQGGAFPHSVLQEELQKQGQADDLELAILSLDYWVARETE